MTHALAHRGAISANEQFDANVVVQPAATMRGTLGVLRRHLLLVVGCAATVVLVAILVTSRMTPVYEAVASLRVDARQPSLPALDALQGIAGNDEITTEIGELSSRTLAMGVVDSLGLRVMVSGPPDTWRSALIASVQAGQGSDSGWYRFEPRADGGVRIRNQASGVLVGDVQPGQRVWLGSASVVLAAGAARSGPFDVTVVPFEAAVTALRKALTVARPTPDANIVTVRYENTDPELARDVPNAVVAQFIRQRQRVQQTAARSTAAFLRTQLARLATQLSSSEDALRAFREQHHIVDLPQQGQSAVMHTADMQAQRDMLEAERVALSALLDDVRVHLPAGTSSGDASPYRNLVAFPTLLRNQAAANLLTGLTDAENRRAELLTRRTMQDPDVQVLSNRVNQIEEQLKGISVTYLQGLTNQVSAFDGVLSQSRQQMERFPSEETDLARLQRQNKSYDDIYTLLQARLKEAEVAEAVQDASVRTVDLANTPRTPVRPMPVLNVSLALLSGLLLGAALAFIREQSDRAVHTRSELQEAVGTAVLGLIPHFRNSSALPGRLRGIGKLLGGGRHVADARPPAKSKAAPGAAGPVTALHVGKDIGVRLMAEAYQRLATNIAFSRQDQPLRRVVITSPMPGDGKTMVAVNLASALAQRGLRVLLIDGDLRRGMINTLLRLPREPGLAGVLMRGIPVAEARAEIRVVGGGALHVITTGALQDNPAPLLLSRHVRPLLDTLDASYDLIIIDSPPINVVTDAALFASVADGVLVVVRAGVTAAPALKLSMEQLRQVQAPVIGAVLNDIDFERDATYDSAYRYYGHNVPYNVQATN